MNNCCKSPYGIGTYTYIDSNTGEKETGYGLWNPKNPNDFYPDYECCTEEEIERWKKDCKEWKEI